MRRSNQLPMESAPLNIRMLAASAMMLAFAGCGGFAPRAEAPTAASPNAIARGAAGKDLLYLSDVKTNTVAIYSYPDGKSVGKLTNLGKPRSECVDTDGDVWVADIEAFQIDKFKPGGTAPSAALSTQGLPSGCSVNPVDGDIAVAGGPNGIVLSIFHRSTHNHWRDAKTFTDTAMKNGYFCGYDAKGNLYLDGKKSDGTFQLAELPYGAKALVDLTIDQAIKMPGQVQWDGKHVAVGDTSLSPSVVYQFSVSGKKATKTGATTLGGTRSVRQFWIDGDRIVGPDYGVDVGIWAYPGGGTPTKKIAILGYGAAVTAAP